MTIKAYTDLEQSSELSKTLDKDSADFVYINYGYCLRVLPIDDVDTKDYPVLSPCWSLTALLKYLSEINPQEYTPILFPSEGKWILQFVEYGHGNVCEVSCDNPIDACCEMILKLYEQKLI